jgi:probable DNA repair protein
LLELPAELLKHLEDGGTVLVPSRQRAAALRLAYSAAMLSAGRRVWTTPDILPWSAWVERGLSEARARAQPMPRRLSGLDDWLLWRAAVCRAAEGRQILAPEQLVDTVRHAASLLEDYGLRLSAGASPEAALLQQALAYYRQRCRELGVQGSGSWYDCRAFLRPSGRLVLAGFEALGTARRHWLEQQGASVFEAAAAALPGSARVAGFAEPAAEAAAAADWCAAALARDPRARLLLVVPRLGEQRHLWQRALSQRLDYGAILDGGDEGGSAYAIEGGEPLARHPLVAAALDLVAFAGAQAQFEQLSALLRSPYLGAFDRAACLTLDVWLREQNLAAATPAALEARIAAIGTGAGQAAAAVAQALLEAAQAMQAPAANAPRAAWARAFAALLKRCGWPGREVLSSPEQQVRMRFDALLGEFGAPDPVDHRLELAEACGLLRQISARVAFEPASDDVAVTVTDVLDDPIVRYDGVWVAGLSADVWPQAARPDALIPPALQWTAGLPGVNAAARLQQAQARQQQWRRCGVQCVLSWSPAEQDLPADISPLLAQLEPAAATTASAPGQGAGAAVFSLERWLAQSGAPLVPWRDDAGLSWPRTQALRGGARLLELQSLCPFRGFAELRLGARPLPAPQPGLDPRLRGRILHRALQLFWQQLQGLAALRALTDEAAHAIARRCAATAIEELGAPAGEGFESWLLARERERTEALMTQLIRWERAREDFVTQALEWPCSYSIAGTTLSLRLDRIDRLDDGRLLVIDYKSGSPERFDAGAARPPQPQLPAYALAVGAGSVAGTLAVYLGRENVRVRGIADRRDRIARLPAAGEAEWPLLLQRWQQQLQHLVQEFLGGHAAVDPQPGACERCHLQGLCRIDPVRLAAVAGSEGEGGDETDEPAGDASAEAQ